jgi:hypothetical protein
MKSVLKKTLCALTLLSTLPALADGTGVGGGTGSREETLALLREKVGPSLVIGAPAPVAARANAPAPLPPELVPSIEQWCDRLGMFMASQLDEAKIQIQFDNPAYAYQILRDALEIGAASIVVPSPYVSPLTKRMIDRGLVIANTLDEVASTHRSLPATRLMAMVEYFEFMVSTLRDLDRPYFIPYHYRFGRCGAGCGGFDYAGFERRYLDYARRQLVFLNRVFTLPPQRGSDKVLPVGDARVYLALVPVVASQVAMDLAGTLAAYEHACSVMRLEGLADKVRHYNRYGRGYPNQAWAVGDVHDGLELIAADIAAGTCH